MTELKDKARNIKGKQYVLVSDRVLAFNELYPNGSIETKIISDPSSDMVIVKATIVPDVSVQRTFTGHSQAKWGDGLVNKTAALENAETSAVGRALGMMGIGVLDSIASADEMAKAGVNSIDTDLRANCRIHNVPLIQKTSQKTGNPYWCHTLPDGSLCFGAK